MLVRKPSTSPINSSSTSTSSSRTRGSASSKGDWDADDESAMSHDEACPVHSNISPLGISATVGPCCPRRPTLREILANTSPAPWTLTAFMAYLSNNHCLETLEFTMDAGRYKKHYAKMLSRTMNDGLPAEKDRDYVRALWQRLVEAYIKPDGSREVNLPSDVRDPILRQAHSDMPPAPETLDSAVAKVYELMEDSVLVPFLNSAWPQSAQSVVSTYSSMPADDAMSITSHTSRNSRMSYHRPEASHSISEPPSFPSRTMNSQKASLSPTSHGSSQFSPTLNGKSRFTSRLSTTTSAPGASVYRNGNINQNGSELSISVLGGERPPGMILDDSGSGNSPIYESPATPPTSPPMSDASSPKRDSGMWKKLGRLGGVKASRKKSQGGLREE